MTNLPEAIAGLDEKKRELLALLARKKGLDTGKAGKAVLPLLPAPRTAESYPSSFAQERLWFLERLRPGDSGYHLPLMRILGGPVNPAALARALGGVARRHESLRTRFVERQGQPFQVIDPPRVAALEPAARLPLVDLSALPAARREEAWLEVHDGIAYTPFDLERGPLVRSVLARLEPEAHRLLVNLHHIITDGWSLDILGREIAVLYDAARQGRAAELPPLALQYVDYAVWQRRWLQGETLERQLDYWRGRLAGASSSLELPADHPRPAVRTSRGHRIRFYLPAAGAGLSALGRRRGATLFMVLLAAWAALLRRLSGSEDLNIGTPVAGRTHRALEPVVGLFVNSLVMRCDLAGDPTFEELLARVQGVAVDAFAHQDLPLEKLVEALRPERALNRAPLFQVMLTLQNTPEQAGFLVGADPAAQAEKLNQVSIVDFDLGLTCFEAGDALGVILEASADLFERATLRRLAGWLANLFTGAAAAPETRVSALPLLAEAQRHQLTAEWNDTAQPGLAADASIHGLFESQAAADPGAVALVDIAADRTWTYGELDAEADRRARHLRQLGVGGGSPVAVYLERSAAQIATFLAVLKAGGAYVPLPVDAPARRLGELLEETGSPFLVSGESQLEWLPPFWVQTVDLHDGIDASEEAWGGAQPPGPSEGPSAPGGDALAYVLHTSGSTGLPKAVAVPHRAVVRLVRETGYARFGNPADPEVFLHMAPAAFDASTLEIWGPLLNGGRLVLMPPGAPSLAGLAAALERHRVTTLWLTAGLFHRMAEDQPEALRGLRQLLAGGDVLSPVQVERVLRQAPGLRLINGYGPTENTTFTCCHVCDAAGPGPVPIGRPIAGTRVHLLGPDLDRVPPGGAGELCAGGSGLAWGYLGRPDLTAEKFIPDPFPAAAEAGARLYRTGDLARFLPDGRVEFLGRLDRQVKIRGFRVEPGEVEAALGEHLAVRQAAVLVREDRPGDKRLVAYVVPAGEAENLQSELQAALADRLPAYAVPGAFVVLGELPLTANGKVDRAALARVEPGGGARGPEFVPPSTPAEQVLAGIWAEVLRRDEPIGAGDNFFDLSGHSLLAVQVVHLVRQTLGVDLPLRLLFERATLADVAREIEAAGRSRSAADLPPLEPAPRGGLLPAGLIPEMMWHVQGGPVHSVYNMPFALRLSGSLDAAALEAAVTALAARHEALRTRFEMGPDGLLQEILPPAPVPLPLVDLAGLPPELREDLARRLAREEQGLPFDMTRAPLFRVRLLRLARPGRDADHVLLFNLHHSIADGWSVALLQNDVAALYAAFRRGEPSPLTELPLHYTDLAVWQRHAYEGPALESRLEYWRRLFADRPPAFAVPADRPVSASGANGENGAIGSRTRNALLTVAGEDARRLRQVSREAGCTVSMTLCALFAAQVHRYNPRGDVVLTSLVAGRDRPDLAAAIGPFLNVAPIRIEVGGGGEAGEPSFRELLRRARAAMLEVYTRQDLPFAKLIAGVLPDQPPSRTALSRVSFNVLSFPAVSGGDAGKAAPDLGGLRLETFLPAEPEAKYDLSFNATEGPDSVLLSLLLAADLFEEASLEAMRDDLQTVLRNALNDPDTPVAALLPEPRYRPAGAES